MKLNVVIQTKIKIDWEIETEDESEIIRDLYEYVKENPIGFMDDVYPEPKFFVAVSKG